MRASAGTITDRETGDKPRVRGGSGLKYTERPKIVEKYTRCDFYGKIVEILAHFAGKFEEFPIF